MTRASRAEVVVVKSWLAPQILAVIQLLPVSQLLSVIRLLPVIQFLLDLLVEMVRVGEEMVLEL